MKYRTFVLDTASGAQELCREHVLKTQYGSNETAFDAYGRGWNTAAGEWRRLLVLMDRMRDAGMGVIVLAHAETKNVPDPLNPEVLQWVPALKKPIWQVTSKWADAVLLPMVSVYANEGRVAGTQRTLRCGFGPPAECKNRWGLPDEIMLGNSAAESWSLFCDAMAAARSGATTELKPSRIVVYGVPGCGKSSFAAHAPDPVFVSDPWDEGIFTLKAYGQVPEEVVALPAPTTWKELLSQCNSILKEE